MSGNYNTVRNSSIASITTLSDKFITVQEADGNYVLRNEGYSAVNDKKVIAQLSPVTQVPANLSNSQIDFRLENIIDVLEYPTLQWTWLNNTGANASVSASPFHIQRIDVMAQNGNSILFSTYDQEIYLSYLWLDRNTYEAQSSAIGLDNNYQNLGTVVPNNNTITLNCPLYGFWKAVKIALVGIKSPIVLRVYFNQQSNIVLTGSVMTCQSLSLILRGKALKNMARKELEDTYSPMNKIPLSLAHLSVDRMTVTQNLVAGQNTKIILTGLTGVCAFLVFTLRSTADITSPSAQNLYFQVKNYDIYDSQGSSLIGYYQRDIQTSQIDFANNWGNRAFTATWGTVPANNTGINIMSWASNPRASFATGVNSGYAIFTGQETLSFTCDSGLVGGQYQIDIRGYMHEFVTYKDNLLKTTRT